MYAHSMCSADYSAALMQATTTTKEEKQKVKLSDLERDDTVPSANERTSELFVVCMLKEPHRQYASLDQHTTIDANAERIRDLALSIQLHSSYKEHAPLIAHHLVLNSIYHIFFPFFLLSVYNSIRDCVHTYTYELSFIGTSTTTIIDIYRNLLIVPNIIISIITNNTIYN